MPSPRFSVSDHLSDPFGLKRLQEQQQRLSLAAAAAAAIGRPGAAAAAAAAAGLPSPVGGGGAGVAAGAIGLAGPNSIYEMSAFSPELNTLQLTTRVRETLASNNIGQKVSCAQ